MGDGLLPFHEQRAIIVMHRTFSHDEPAQQLRDRCDTTGINRKGFSNMKASEQKGRTISILKCRTAAFIWVA